MKINDRYEIRVVVVEIREGIGNHHGYGDVYDNFEEFKKDKPDSSYKFGFIVVDTETGYVPDSCNEWNDSPEEALRDYYENIEAPMKAKENEDWPTAEWVYRNGILVCSHCRYHPNYSMQTRDGFSNGNFCPNCGAKMK